jgi:drug/metabolite transporter (DMT)-like permease
MLYYGIITIAVAMFSINFFFSQLFQKSYGNGIRASFVLSAGSNLIALIFLLAVNRFQLGFTPFTFLIAFLNALNGICFTFCSLKALGKINLSLYSVFSMLGGMALPFVAGILFYNEALTTGKVICFVIIIIALFLTVEKSDSHSGFLYYAGIFILNGMSGVLSKIFQAGPFAKASATDFSILSSMITVVLSVICLLAMKGEKRPLNKTAFFSMAGNGILNRVGNLLLLIALAHLPASAQYPFVTGGVMIFSTLIAYFTPNKPRKRELITVALSFIGILFLVFL